MNNIVSKKISEAIKFKTVSYQNELLNDYEEYKKFLDYLKEAFPLVHKNLELTMINNYSPVYRWISESDKLPILFLAHYDVVSTGDDLKWKHPPFEGKITDTHVWGRGSLDCKHQLIAIMQTIENLLMDNKKPQRDIYLAFGYDEEVGGEKGAKNIAKHFKDNNIKFDFVLDEGGAVSVKMLKGVKDDIALIGLAEKGSTHIKFTFESKGGHSSMPETENSITLASKFIRNIKKKQMKPRLIEIVDEMFKSLSKHLGIKGKLFKNPKRVFNLLSKVIESDPTMNALIRTTITPTIINGGEAENAIPSKTDLTLNIRILQGDTVTSVTEYIIDATKFKGTYKYIQREEPSNSSSPNTEQYRLLEKYITKNFNNTIVIPYLMAGGTDARHYDEVSDNIYRFTPIKMNDILFKTIHSYDERISFDNIDHMMNFYSSFIGSFTEKKDEA